LGSGEKEQRRKGAEGKRGDKSREEGGQKEQRRKGAEGKRGDKNREE